MNVDITIGDKRIEADAGQNDHGLHGTPNWGWLTIDTPQGSIDFWFADPTVAQAYAEAINAANEKLNDAALAKLQAGAVA